MRRWESAVCSQQACGCALLQAASEFKTHTCATFIFTALVYFLWQKAHVSAPPSVNRSLIYMIFSDLAGPDRLPAVSFAFSMPAQPFMLVFVCLMWFMETDEYLFVVFLCRFLNEFKVVLMVVLSVAAAKAFYNVMITIFEIFRGFLSL